MTADMLQKAVQILRQSSRTVVFTGAGISVESGIPPFRGPGGIWETYDQSVLDIQRYFDDTKTCWAAIRELFYSSMAEARPNDAHLILGSWEKRGLIHFTVTQNIDGLHQKGGAVHVAEFHGNAQYLVCSGCHRRFPAEPRFIGQDIPVCPSCGRILKPDFIFFGEGIPEKAAADSYKAAENCTAMIVIGSSGEVYPAAGLPPLAKHRGAAIIEINPYPSTYTQSIDDVYIPMKAGAALTALDALLAEQKK